MKRREFLVHSAAAAIGTTGLPAVFAAAHRERSAKILWRGSWPRVNIGDIGHTPGALRLVEQHFPEAEASLWPGQLGHGSRKMLAKGIRKRMIAAGTVGKDERPTNSELTKVWEDAESFLKSDVTPPLTWGARP